MSAMEQHIQERGPICRNDDSFARYLPGSRNNDIVDQINEHGFGMSSLGDVEGGMSITNCEEFGFGTKSVGFLSQGSQEVETLVQQGIQEPQKGDNLWNLVQSTISTIKTYEQRVNFEDTMRSIAARNIAQNNPSYKSGGLTMLSMDESGKSDSAKRKRQSYEGYCSV